MKEKEKSPSGRGEYSAEEIESLVDLLKSIKNRIVKADMDLIYYADLYKEDLARIDSRTIERVIQILKDLV